jgi:hypothetical protein
VGTRILTNFSIKITAHTTACPTFSNHNNQFSLSKEYTNLSSMEPGMSIHMGTCLVPGSRILRTGLSMSDYLLILLSRNSSSNLL